MKKFLIMFLSMILLLTMPLSMPVLAATNTHHIEALGLRLNIPTEYSVVTRDTPASSPIFEKLGVPKSTIINQFKKDDTYLCAVSSMLDEEVVVSMKDSDFLDFNTLSDTQLDVFVSLWEEQFTDLGVRVFSHEIYQQAQIKFAKFHIADVQNDLYAMAYFTVYDANLFTFSIRSYDGNLSYKQKNTIKGIVDSIKFDKTPPSLPSEETTDSFAYTDTEGDVTFTVPANWKKEKFTEDREFLDVKFVSTKDAGCSMLYTSIDSWSQLSASQKVGLTRADIDNSMFSKADIAEMYGATADKVSMVTYNGVQYFKFETAKSEVHGVTLPVGMTHLINVNNGWIYAFQFSGKSTHKLYSDFLNLVKSVRYSNVPTTTTTTRITTTSKSTIATTLSGSATTPAITTAVSNEESSKSFDSGLIVAVVIILLAAATVLMIVVKGGRKKKNMLTEKPIEDVAEAVPLSGSVDVRYCRKCGQEMPPDSEFCHKCGTRVDKVDGNE